MPAPRLAAEEGVVFPDHFDHDWRAGSAERVFAAIDRLRPGVDGIDIEPVREIGRHCTCDRCAALSPYAWDVAGVNQMAGVLDGMNIKTRPLKQEVCHVPAPDGVDYNYIGTLI